MEKYGYKLCYQEMNFHTYMMNKHQEEYIVI